MRTAIGICAVLLGMATIAAAQGATVTLNPPVRIFFWTARPAILGFDQKDREDSVSDLKGHVDRAVFALAVSRDDADLDVEVVRRGLIATGNSSSLFGRFAAITVASKTPVIQTTIRVGDYATDLTCDQGLGTWGDRARACDNSIRKWVLDNLAQIHEARASR